MDSIYMKSAIAEAEKAYAEGETPVGAVIVRDGEIIASAHNMTERLNDSHRSCGASGNTGGRKGDGGQTAHRLRAVRHNGAVPDVRWGGVEQPHRGDSIRRMGSRDGQLRLPD